LERRRNKRRHQLPKSKRKIKKKKKNKIGTPRKFSIIVPRNEV